MFFTYNFLGDVVLISTFSAFVLKPISPPSMNQSIKQTNPFLVATAGVKCPNKEWKPRIRFLGIYSSD